MPRRYKNSKARKRRAGESKEDYRKRIAELDRKRESYHDRTKWKKRVAATPARPVDDDEAILAAATAIIEATPVLSPVIALVEDPPRPSERIADPTRPHAPEPTLDPDARWRERQQREDAWRARAVAQVAAIKAFHQDHFGAPLPTFESTMKEQLDLPVTTSENGLQFSHGKSTDNTIMEAPKSHSNSPESMSAGVTLQPPGRMGWKIGDYREGKPSLESPDFQQPICRSDYPSNPRKHYTEQISTCANEENCTRAQEKIETKSSAEASAVPEIPPTWSPVVLPPPLLARRLPPLAPQAYAEQLLIVTWLTRARAITNALLTLRCGTKERLMLAEAYRRHGALREFAWSLGVLVDRVAAAAPLGAWLEELLDAPVERSGGVPSWWWDAEQIHRRFELVVEGEMKRGTFALLLDDQGGIAG